MKVYTDAPLFLGEDSTKLTPIREVELVDKNDKNAVILYEGTCYIVNSKDVYGQK